MVRHLGMPSPKAASRIDCGTRSRTSFRGPANCGDHHDAQATLPARRSPASGPAINPEAALGLGIPKWRTILSVVVRTASSGIVTSIMLAFARIAGETAPLMFTALGNQYWSKSLNQPTGGPCRSRFCLCGDAV